jgi:hypothetical protein
LSRPIDAKSLVTCRQAPQTQRRDVSQSVVHRQRYRPVCHRTDHAKDGNRPQPVESLSKACMIGTPAHEKETYSAYSAFSALLFGNWRPTASVQSRDKSAGWNAGTCRLAKAGALSFHLMVGDRRWNMWTNRQPRAADLSRLSRLFRSFFWQNAPRHRRRCAINYSEILSTFVK